MDRNAGQETGFVFCDRPAGCESAESGGMKPQSRVGEALKGDFLI